MAIELAPHAIRVNAIGPGSVGTEMAFATHRDPTAVTGLGPTKEQLMFARTPLGRPYSGQLICHTKIHGHGEIEVSE